MSSTLGLPNRVRDLKLVNTHLRADGSASVRLWERHVQRDAADGPQTLLAVGYRRVPSAIMARISTRAPPPPEAFAAEPPKELLHYIEYSASGATLRAAAHGGSRPNRRRKGGTGARTIGRGYADYRVGLFYLSCSHVLVARAQAAGDAVGLRDGVGDGGSRLMRG